MKSAVIFAAVAGFVSTAAAAAAAAADEGMLGPMILEHKKLAAVQARKLKKRQIANDTDDVIVGDISAVDLSHSVSPNFQGNINNSTIINMSNSSINIWTNGQPQAPAPGVPQANAYLWWIACKNALANTSPQYPGGFFNDPTWGAMYGVVQNGTAMGCMVNNPNANGTQSYAEYVYPCGQGAQCQAYAYIWGSTTYGVLCCGASCGCGGSATASPSATPTSDSEGHGCPVGALPTETDSGDHGCPVSCTPAPSCSATPAPPAPAPAIGAGSKASVGITMGLAVAAMFGALL